MESLDRVLIDLRRAAGMRAQAIVSREGILVAADMPSDVHAETFAAMAAILRGAAETAALEIHERAPDRIIVETDRGRLVVAGAGERLMLVALVDAGAGLGHLIVEMSRAIVRIKEIVGE